MNLVRVKNVIKTIERHPVEILGNDYRVKIEYRNVKIMELDVCEDTIKIILQNKYKKVNNEKMLDFAINKMYNSIAKVEIERAMEKTRLMVGFAPEDYKIENMKELANCKDGIITINPEIVKFNRKVIDYLVLKQFLHLKYKTECKGYFNLLKKYCKNYENFEKALKF